MKNSNTKEVIAKVQAHMIRHQGGKKILYSELTNRSYGPTVYARVKKMVNGGMFLVYYKDIRDFLNKIGYTKAQLEKMSDAKVWDLYTHLLGRMEKGSSGTTAENSKRERPNADPKLFSSLFLVQ